MPLAVLAAITLLAVPARGAAPMAVPESLEWAGRFADALTSDVKDRERAQEAVALDMAMKGALEVARRRADAIEGWRRGIAWAEIAKLAARAGRLAEARELVGRAAALASETEGWQGPRIEAHVAQARALVGDVDSSIPVTERLQRDDALQYRGLPGVLRATGHVARGEVSDAMAQLEAVGTEAAIEVAWPMTNAYLEIARHPGIERSRRLAALDAARLAARRVEERITRLDAFALVADGYREAGHFDRATSLLDEFHALVAAMPDATVLKAPFLADEARIRARLGDAAGARRVLDAAVGVASQAYTIDRPAVLANVAAGFHVLGDPGRAATVLASSLSAAEGLVNARPRALAFVEIGRVLGRFDVPMTAPVRERFRDALVGLKEPW